MSDTGRGLHVGPRIIFTTHARARASECGISEAALRQRLVTLSSRLAPFVGSRSKIGLMHRGQPSPVVRLVTPGRIEVVTILRPGQTVVRSDTIPVTVA